MKRGLRLSLPPCMIFVSTGPNTGPDEEGVETLPYSSLVFGIFEGPNTGPDEEGVETFHFLSISLPPCMSPNTGPDEEGVETIESLVESAQQIRVRIQAPMKRGLRQVAVGVSVGGEVGPNTGPDEEGVETGVGASTSTGAVWSEYRPR